MTEMEKYGVEEEEADVKTAGENSTRCPVCKSELRNTSVTGVFLCPKCGSKPFEVQRGTSKHR